MPLTSDEYETKWETFFSRGFAPWDSGLPASQLVHFFVSKFFLKSESVWEPLFFHFSDGATH